MYTKMLKCEFACYIFVFIKVEFYTWTKTCYLLCEIFLQNKQNNILLQND